MLRSCLTTEVVLADSAYAAEAFVLFEPAAVESHDRLNAYALAPHVATYAALFTQRDDGATLVIDARPVPQPDAPQRLPLDVWAVADGEIAEAAVTLIWPDLSALPADWTLTLEDTRTGTTIDLRETDAYTFETALPSGGNGLRTAARWVASAPPDAGPGAPPTPRPLDRAAARHAATLNAEVVSGKELIARSAARQTPRFVLHVTAATVTTEEPAALPEVPQVLDAVYPNPTSGRAVVGFALDAARPVRLAVYDALGRLVATLADGPYDPVSTSSYLIRWPGQLVSMSCTSGPTPGSRPPESLWSISRSASHA